MRVEQVLIEAAARHGHRAAVVVGGVSRSYAELDRRSDRLASALARRGVGAGDRIAVYLDVGFPAIVTVFGVLKAGAALLPIEPADSAEALARHLNLPGVSGIVTEARLALKAARALCDAPQVRLVVLANGDRNVTQSGCLNFEDIVEGGDGAPLANPATAEHEALVLPGADGSVISFRHADVVAVPQALCSDAATLCFAAPGVLAHLVAAFRAGATRIVDGGAGDRTPPLTPADYRDVRRA